MILIEVYYLPLRSAIYLGTPLTPIDRRSPEDRAKGIRPDPIPAGKATHATHTKLATHRIVIHFTAHNVESPLLLLKSII